MYCCTGRGDFCCSNNRSSASCCAYNKSRIQPYSGDASDDLRRACHAVLDITVECYPYTATQTTIESAVYDEGWQETFGITYGDLQWAETGERLTAESFARYRKTGGMVIAHSIPGRYCKINNCRFNCFNCQRWNA